MSAAETCLRPEALVLTDAELVQRVIQGDLNAYGDLIHRHQQPLYRYFRGMGIDYDTSLDLVQDALLKAYTRLGECRNPERFRAWLFSIGRNLCLDYLKNVRRLSVPFSMLPGAEFISSSEAEQTELKRTLAEALNMLSNDLRDAFLLKHDAGYTYEEIADISAASPSAIKMRVHRAREILSAFLTEPDGYAAEVTNGGRPIVLEE